MSATDCTRPAERRGRDLAPQDGRDLVAVEAVEDAAGLLRLDQPLVELARISPSARSIASRVISWKTRRRCGTFGLEHLQQVPADRLALAVFVGREQQLVGALERVLELCDRLLLVVGDDVERLEVLVDRDADVPYLAPSPWGLAGPIRRSRMWPMLDATL